MKIIFAGTPENAAHTLKFLKTSGYEIGLVLTREDAPVGRKQILTPSAVAIAAAELGLPILKANRIDGNVNARLSEVGADIGVVVAFGVIFRKETLEIPRLGWLNVHYSLLPRWRGASPVQTAILQGDTETGVTVFKLDEGMDSGPVWSTSSTMIQPRENAEELLDRLTLLGESTLLEALPLVASGIREPTPQNTAESTLTKRILRNDARLDFSESSVRLERLIRSMNPEPMAWCLWRNESLQILDAWSIGSAQLNALALVPQEPGIIESLDNAVIVHTGKGGLLELKTVKPAGKQSMKAADWIRGFNRTKDWLLN